MHVTRVHYDTFYQSALRHELHWDVTPSSRKDSGEKVLMVVIFRSDLPVKRCEGDRAWLSWFLRLFLMQYVEVCKSGRLLNCDVLGLNLVWHFLASVLPVLGVILKWREIIVNGLNLWFVWSSGWVQFWKELLLVTDVSPTWAEFIFWVKWIVVVSRWCYKSGPLKAIGQLSHDGVGRKTRVRFCYQSLVGFDPSFVSQISRFEVRILLVKLSRSVRSQNIEDMKNRPMIT